MKHPSRLKRATGIVLSMFLSLGYFSPMQQALRTLPDTLALTQGQVREMNLGAQLQLTPRQGNLAVSASDDETLGQVALVSETAGTSELMLSLMGILPLKKVEVQVSPEKRLIPGGSAIGVAMRTDGVLVVGTSDLSEAVSPAALCGIRPGGRAAQGGRGGDHQRPAADGADRSPGRKAPACGVCPGRGGFHHHHDAPAG